MVKEYLKNRWRKLDNTAKIFSLETDSNINVFRYSVVLKVKIEKDTLLKALNKALEYYSVFRTKICSGIFWNYLEFNPKEVKVFLEDDVPCQFIDFKENNDYLFRVSYYKNKINVDFFHILTDGTGAAEFMKFLIYNYLDLKYDNKFYEEKDIKTIDYQDQYLKNYDRNDKTKHDVSLAFQIKGKILDVNNTYHYVIPVSAVKKLSKDSGVSITEYLTALYIYAMYTSIYDGRSGKEIIITVPINLRKYYDVDTLSNFFACMDINPRLVSNGIISFEDCLMAVHGEFKKKLTDDKVRGYLNRDVRLGLNLPIRLVPLPIKRFFINLLCKVINRTVTSTVSNVGKFDIDDKYKKYVDNVYVLVLPGKVQKIKCTVCSYDNNLNVTINSNINDVEFEKRFYELLKEKVNKVKVINNTGMDFR